MKAAGDDFSDELSLVVDGEKAAHTAVSSAELNFIDPDVRKQLRTRKVIAFHPPCGHNSADSPHCGTALSILYITQYPRPVSDAYLKEIQRPPGAKGEGTLEPPEETEVGPSGTDLETSTPQTSGQDVDMSQTYTPDTPMRFAEKKRLHWAGKTCEWFRSVEWLG